MNSTICIVSVLAMLAGLSAYLFFKAKKGIGKDLNSNTRGGERPVSIDIVEEHRMSDFVSYLEKHKCEVPAFGAMLKKYKIKRRFPDMRSFRIGPHMIDDIPLDWMVVFLKGGDESGLIAHAMMTRIAWDGTPEKLPDGWRGAVRSSYEDSVVSKKVCNSLVGMFVQVEEGYKKSGWASTLVNEMLSFGKRQGLISLIIPLRLPQRYEREYAEMPYEEFAFLKREDGQYRDHWLRLHVRLGGKIVGVCKTSHRHVMDLKDFYQQFGQNTFTESGHRLIKTPDGWQQVYIDLERKLVVIDQGCVWIEHKLV